MRSYAAVPHGKAVPYHHRDPAFVTPARLAELQARDRRRELLERPVTSGGRRQAEERETRVAEFARHRAAGLSVKEAATQMEIGARTARGYEAARKLAAGGDA